MSESSSVPSRPVTPVSTLPDQIHTARPYRFVWDPSSRRPGPESVSGTTEGRGGGDYFSAQPRLSFLNSSSTAALALGALPAEWSSSKHGFHAISTMLNNPHKRQAPPKAHSSLPAVVPADLPRVRRKDFNSYLRVIGPEWEHFQRNIQLGREGLAQLDPGPSTPRASADADDVYLRSRLPNPLEAKPVPPLDSVPPVFFEQQFDLGDPRTFNIVTEQNLSSDGREYDPAMLAHSIPLLEKFSHYADTVEQHLVLEIQRRSTSFFAALTNLHDLRSESEECIARISRLRAQLTNLDENSAKRGLQVVRREARALNVAKVVEGVKFIAGVVEMSRVARGLVSAGQWGEALGIIEDLQRLWDGGAESSTPSAKMKIQSLPEVKEEREEEEQALQGNGDSPEHMSNGLSGQVPPHSGRRRKNSSPPPILLSSLKAYSSLPEHLRALTLEIASSLSSELISVLKVDLADRIGRRRDHPKVNPDRGAELDRNFRDRLRPLLHGLMRTRGLKDGIISWRDIALKELRSVVKEKLPATDSEEDGSDSTSNTRAGLANHLRDMPHPDFMLLLQDLYVSLFNGVEGVQEQETVILEIIESVPESVGADSTAAIQDELSDILSSVAELANAQAAKIISCRQDQHVSLELADFLVFFNETWGFVVRCEIICRRMIVGLRGAVVSQAKAFLQNFHQARITKSAKFVEDEQWNPAEVSPSLQHITNVIVDSAVRDAPELVIKSDADTIFSESPTSPSSDRPTANGDGSFPALSRGPPPPPVKSDTNGFSSVSSAPGAKHLRIDERTYFVVSATAEVLVLLLDYLRVVVNLSMLTTDAMSRVIEFLKAFNSRTCQVVLGAGALRSAGLKNITAKHLALASQSLSVMFELIPYVRETFRRHLSPKQAVMLVEFDKLKRDFQEHQNEIHSKLIAIMGERLNTHIKTLQGIDWNVPKPGGGINDYMEILIKETVTLHKVLSRYLSTPIVEYVMTQVFAAINHGLSEEYSKIELPHQEAKERLLADAKYLHQKLSALKNVGMPSGMLVTVVSEKTIPRTNVPPPTPTRSNTVHGISSSANQRLKGLLSGKSVTFDKVLPTPIRQATSPPPSAVIASSNSPTPSADLPSIDKAFAEKAAENEVKAPTATFNTADETKPSAGFKQVQLASPKPGSEPEPDAGLAPTPTEDQASAEVSTLEPARLRLSPPPLPEAQSEKDETPDATMMTTPNADLTV